MKKLTAEALKDFRICALHYELKHEKKLDTSPNIRERRVNRFDETVKKVCTFFLYKKQAYAEPSYQALLNRWQKLWFAEGTSASDIAALKNEILWGNDTSYTTQAAVAFLKFFEEFADKQGTQVLLVDEKFCVPLGKEIALEGSFDLVTREQDPDGVFHYKIYKWITNNLKKPITYWAFDFAVQAYAFKYRNNNKPLRTSYYLWDFGSTVPGAKEIEIEKDDLDSISYWAELLNSTEIFVPRRGLTSLCKSCPFDKECRNWHFPEKQK